MILVCIPYSDSNRRMRAGCKHEHHYMCWIASNLESVQLLNNPIGFCQVIRNASETVVSF
jgi:hypothetical protein